MEVTTYTNLPSTTSSMRIDSMALKSQINSGNFRVILKNLKKLLARSWEIQYSEIKLDKELGRGSFGKKNLRNFSKISK